MIQFNLLPWRHEQRIRRLTRHKRILLLGLLTGLLTGLIWLSVQYYRQYDYQQALSIIGQENQKLLLKLKEQKKLNYLKKTLNQQIDTIEALQGSRANILNVIETLSSVSHQGLFLTQLTVKDNVISLTGIAKNDQQVAQFMIRLGESPYFQEPKLLEISARPQIGEQAKQFMIESQVTATAVRLVGESPDG
ncbi:MAG: hypothetical protein CSA44_00490 [Gammaproteobacteria bacterium]|nr:MAG: hypothetical protein CSA44_00490 [Gammaproteobacteria bacterium]